MYNLTMSQRNIYWSDRSAPGLPVSTLHTVLWFLEEIDAALLKKAADFVISGNDIFRLRLIHRGGEVLQDFSGKLRACAADPAVYTDEELDRILLQRKNRVLPLEGCLYDFTIYRKENGLCLSISTHHIIIDGYGIGLLCDEILRVYQQLLGGAAPSLKALPFSASLTNAESASDEDKAFWANYFDGYDPGGRPFAAGTGVAAASVFKGEIEAAGILGFCAEHSVTPYTVFAAALGIYLMNIYGSDDTAVIIPRMNRSPGERKTLGDFVLPVPVRIRKTSDFASLCKQIAIEGREASRHKRYDFSQIIEEFKERFGGERAVSEFTMNFQQARLNSKIKTRMEFSACGAMRNLLTLNISNYGDDDAYTIDYDYRSDVISERYIGFFHASLENIIRQGISGTPTDEIQILPDAELLYLQNSFKGEAVPYDKDETIVTLFRRTAQALPSATAVFASDRELTFAELDALSDKIAGALLEKGAQKGALIGFLLERNSSLIPVILGILKAGCGFLPLDINYPIGRIQYIVENSKAAMLISTPELAESRGLDFVNVSELLQGEAPAPADATLRQDDLAYCIYTSGTTGQPKGVMLSHKGIVNIASPLSNPFNKAVSALGTGVAAIGSICFDISLFEIFVFLLNGKFVALAADDDLANGEAIAKVIQKSGANALHCTPSRLHSYLSGARFEEALRTRIKLILSAGEVLPAQLADLLAKEYQVDIYNGYGPTETTIGATVTQANDCETIGRPIANTAVRIVDRKRKLLPFGVTGEIAVTGDGVGIGYLGNKQLTDERFVLLHKERAYLTGDLGYFTPDGRLKYVARNDNQIKLKGFRIELAEIEQCALAYKGVEGCAVIVKEMGGERYLILYYSGGQADSGRLKEHLRQFLPYYMIPRAVLGLPTLPVNINGKVDRQALEDLDLSTEREYTPPTTREEEILCEAFQSVLSLERVGVNDNFFEIGGTSLLAVMMMMHVNKFDLDVEYSAIFKYPTPQLLAKNLKKDTLVNLLQPFASEHAEELGGIADFLRKKPVESLSRAPLGTVLFTGATGFLGSHIVKLLLEDSSVSKIYCLVRAKGKLSPEKRLKTMLFYYFSDIKEEDFAEKIEVVDGSITDKALFAGFSGEVDTVINCAANVAHFAYGDALRSVNTDAVENLIAFCMNKNATLIHISTISVAGNNLGESIRAETIFTEHDLYKEQIISNEYIYSKLAAEYLILRAKQKGLNAKIMRVGNLQARMDDGEFQVNLQENAFARVIKSYASIGAAPDSLRDEAVNITPVDETASAVLCLAGLDDSYSIFHVINPLPVPYGEIFSALGTIEKEMRYMETSEFEALVDRLSRDDAESGRVQGLLLEKSDIRLMEMPVDCDFTVEILRSLGFAFKPVEKDYMENYLKLLDGLGFFDYPNSDE